MSGPGSCFRRWTAATASSLINVVLRQPADVIVREKTTLGASFMRDATSGMACAAIGVGHQAAIMS